MPSQSESALINEAILEQLTTPGMQKQAIDAINDYTRTTMREDGFYRRIIPPLPVTNGDLHRQVDTPKPCIIVDKEPGSPAAVSIPFATQPIEVYIRGKRYRVTFSRITTPRFTVDVDELRTWVMDIRQVMSDNALKDLLAVEDGQFMTAVEAVLVGADQVVPYSGVAQWETIAGGITRDTWEDSLKIMERTDSHLAPRTALMNNITIHEFKKWGRDEMGGDFSQDVVKNGWTEVRFGDLDLVITIKRNLVPDNRIYYFADPKFIGKNYVLEDTIMNVKAEAFMIEFFAYETVGGSIGHSGGLAAATFE